MRKVSQKIEVHPFEKKIQQSYDLAKKIMSAKNYKLFERYDMVMIGDTIATSTRHHQLSIIINLTRQINKDWELITKEEINKLVYDIMKNYSTDGKENWTTWDYKKYCNNDQKSSFHFLILQIIKLGIIIAIATGIIMLPRLY